MCLTSPRRRRLLHANDKYIQKLTSDNTGYVLEDEIVGFASASEMAYSQSMILAMVEP